MKEITNKNFKIEWEKWERCYFVMHDTNEIHVGYIDMVFWKTIDGFQYADVMDCNSQTHRMFCVDRLFETYHDAFVAMEEAAMAA